MQRSCGFGKARVQLRCMTPAGVSRMNVRTRRVLTFCSYLYRFLLRRLLWSLRSLRTWFVARIFGVFDSLLAASIIAEFARENSYLANIVRILLDL